MSVRQALILALVGGSGYIAWRIYRDGIGNLINVPLNFSDDAGVSNPGNWLSVLGQVESGGNPLAKNPRSSASGLYQFTKGTWQALGGQWGDDPTQPFGGLAPSVAEQTARAAALTQQNANALQRAGVAASNAALYAAHFLGAGTAVKALSADPSTSLQSVVGSAVIAANPNLKGYSVADFMSWLQRKVG